MMQYKTAPQSSGFVGRKSTIGHDEIVSDQRSDQPKYSNSGTIKHKAIYNQLHGSPTTDAPIEHIGANYGKNLEEMRDAGFSSAVEHSVEPTSHKRRRENVEKDLNCNIKRPKLALSPTVEISRSEIANEGIRSSAIATENIDPRLLSGNLDAINASLVPKTVDASKIMKTERAHPSNSTMNVSDGEDSELEVESQVYQQTKNTPIRGDQCEPKPRINHQAPSSSVLSKYPGLNSYLRHMVPRVREKVEEQYFDPHRERLELAKEIGLIKSYWMSGVLLDLRDSGRLKRKRLEPSENEEQLAAKRLKREDEEKLMHCVEEGCAKSGTKETKRKPQLYPNEAMLPISAWFATLLPRQEIRDENANLYGNNDSDHDLNTIKEDYEMFEEDELNTTAEDSRAPRESKKCWTLRDEVLRSQAGKHLLKATGSFPKILHRFSGTNIAKVFDGNVGSRITSDLTRNHHVECNKAWLSLFRQKEHFNSYTLPQPVFAKRRDIVVNDDGRCHAGRQNKALRSKSADRKLEIRQQILESADGDFTLISHNAQEIKIYEERTDKMNGQDIKMHRRGSAQSTDNGISWWKLEQYEEDDLDLEAIEAFLKEEEV